MRKYKKNGTIYILVLLLLGITLGYAYLNTTLNINGTTNITSANWSIYWDNIQFGSNNVTDITTPATISQGLTEVTFNVNFKEPGDTYEFTVDAVNDGSINAMISVVNSGVYAANGTTPKTLPDYLEYTVTYSDGVTIATNHLLEAGDTETYKVRVHYKEDISASQLPSTNDNYMFKFSVTYAQADSNGVSPHTTTCEYTDDENNNYIYNVNEDVDFYIGQSVPNNATTYNSYNELKNNTDKQTFLRYKVENNIITEAYVGVVKDNCVYILRGGVDESSLPSTPIYNHNVEVLNQLFESEECEEGPGDGYHCDKDTLSYAYISLEGKIDSAFFHYCPVIDIYSEGDSSTGRTGLYTS